MTINTTDDRLTHQAAAVLVARDMYAEALKQDNPAASLDDICDALPKVMPQVFQELGTAPDLAAALLPEVTDRVWAFTAVEHARAEAGDGYGYLFDYLADGLRKGADPHTIRKAALDAPKRIRELAAEASA